MMVSEDLKRRGRIADLHKSITEKISRNYECRPISGGPVRSSSEVLYEVRPKIPSDENSVPSAALHVVYDGLLFDADNNLNVPLVRLVHAPYDALVFHDLSKALFAYSNLRKDDFGGLIYVPEFNYGEVSDSLNDRSSLSKKSLDVWGV